MVERELPTKFGLLTKSSRAKKAKTKDLHLHADL